MMQTGEVPDPKADHVGVAAPPFGPCVYLVVRHDGTMVACEESRHDALTRIFEMHSCDDYTIEYVPIGSIPLEDVRF